VFADGAAKLADLPLAPPGELPRDDARTPFDTNSCVHDAIAAQAQRTPDRVALEFFGSKLTYRELDERATALARSLVAQGVQPGDIVGLNLERSLELAVAQLAIMKAGAAYLPLDPDYPRERIAFMAEDSRTRLVIDAQRFGQLAAGAPDAPLPASDPQRPAYVIYTSGSTGKPKGIQHSSAGYLLGVKVTSQWVFDLNDSDVFWCTADVGWVTGHSYVAYGPLANGATVVMYEGAPHIPDGGRFWKICQDHGVTVFYTAPTAIRALMKLGDDLPARYDLSRLRLLGTVGEPINPEAWMWYHRVIGQGRCPIVDTWWQTETGNIMISPLPALTATKPGSCTRPLPGIVADIVDEDGNAVTEPGQGGFLVIRKPWPAMLRTIWGDNHRYVSTYWERFHKRYYVAGDSAQRDEDGYFWIMGRIDDVLNVAGHRLGTMEIESALVAHTRVAEAAVVGRPHEIKGESVFAYVVCKGTRPTGDTSAFVRELRDWVSEQLGAIARPDDIRFADNLPKTRSGKIMRRLLRAIARDEEITQDVSTLENPAIIEQLRGVDVASAATTSKQRKPKRADSKANARRTPAKRAKKSQPRKSKQAKRSTKAHRTSKRRAARPK
jgi:acyl-coenzyme A synthetase/AMP-(fatty) acid ligase